MNNTSEHRELLRVLENCEIDGFPVTVGGRRVADVVRELIQAPRLPAELVPLIEAIAKAKGTEKALDEAREAHDAAELELAELVGTTRRDKDMSFDAHYDSNRIIVEAAIAAVSGVHDDPSGPS